MGVIYELEFPQGKRYVGQTTVFKRRMKEHERGGKSTDGHVIKRAILKHGWANVKVAVLEEVSDNALLGQREQYWIRIRRSMVHEWGYNLTAGGDAQPMDHPVVQEWHKKQIKEAMNRDDVRAKKSALWQNESHKEMMAKARLNFESAEKRRLSFAKKREKEVAIMSEQEGKELMRKARDRIEKNALSRGGHTPGQQSEAVAFWEREWARYNRLYWSAPPQASSISPPSAACAPQEVDESMIPSDYEDGEEPGGS